VARFFRLRGSILRPRNLPETPPQFLPTLVVWLANCYFAHDSSGFPTLLLFFDAQSCRSCWIATLARLLGPGGVRSLVAESLLLKHHLLIEAQREHMAFDPILLKKQTTSFDSSDLVDFATLRKIYEGFVKSATELHRVRR
jgi:hypothetical protein